MDRTTILTTLRETLERSPSGLLTAYLFGSFGRGERREENDVDLGLLYEQRRARAARSLRTPARSRS